MVRSVDAGAVRRATDAYAAELLARPEVEEVVVFGSFEQDRYAPGSDLDVFVVLTAAILPVRDRIPALLPESFPVAVDLFPFTRAEMRALAPSPLLDAVESSRWRYRRGAARDAPEPATPA